MLTRSTFKRPVYAPARQPTRPVPALFRAPEPVSARVVAVQKTAHVEHEGYRRLVAALPCIHCGMPGLSQCAHPKALKAAGYPVGRDNDRHIIEVCTQADAVCLAYGPLAAGLERPQVVLPMLRGLGIELLCLRMTRSGYPGHPLMLPKTCRLMPFTNEAVQAAMRAQHG